MSFARTSVLTTSAALTAWGVHASYLLYRLHHAQLDPLTGLCRREAFTRRSTRMLAQHPEAAVLLLDVDEFKQVNDTFGHEAGDVLLSVTADRLRRVLPQAVLARLGGDEFAATVPHTPDLEAVQAALATPVLHQHGVTTPALSVGVAPGAHRAGLSVALRAADVAMYAAKTTGGAAATVAPGQHGPPPGRRSRAARPETASG